MSRNHSAEEFETEAAKWFTKRGYKVTDACQKRWLPQPARTNGLNLP